MKLHPRSMSYNGAYNYSPYYQTGGDGGRGQDSYQNPTASISRYASGYGASNPTTNQPQQPSYNQPSQQSSNTPVTTALDRSAVSYSRYGSNSGSNQYQDLRGEYNFTDRSSAGNTPLGNLAHASSLEQDARNSAAPRDSRSLQQIIDYNRSQNRQSNVSPLYGTNAPVNYGHQRSDSRGTESPGIPPYRNQASTDTSVANQSQYLQHGTNAGYSAPAVAYTTTQDVPQNTPNINSYSSYQPNTEGQSSNAYYPQVSRPASGQSYRAQAPNTQISQSVNHSPPVSANRVPPSVSASHVSPGTTVRSDPAASQQRQYLDRRPSASPAQSSNQHTNHHTNSPASRYPAPASTTQNSYSGAKNSTSVQHLPNTRPEARTSISSEEQIPATVDPSHVFNQQEYQRRQAAAAAEVAARKAAEEDRSKKVAEAEDSRKAAEAAAALKRVSESQISATRDSELSREEQMAAEMRQMIEKMRDYKSKDPTLFSSIWEQVKKTQPAGSVPSAPPLSAKDIPSVPAPHSQANGVNEILSPSPAPDADGELPDLGKFPALRRRRGGKSDSPARRRKSAGKPLKDSSPKINGLQSDPPIDPAIIEASNRSEQQPTPNLQPNSTIPPANGIPPDQNRQVVYVSGTGPRATPPADSSLQTAIASVAPPASTEQRPSTQDMHPVQTPAPTSSSVGKTSWPEHKKWDLAVAAKNILLSMPVNSSKAKSISPEQILAYLNENPSYEQLCQMIESKGLIIGRGHFARSLLEAVPGMAGGVHQQRQALASRPPASYLNSQHPNGAGNDTLASQVNSKFLDQNQRTVSNKAPTAQMTPSSIEAPPIVEEKPKAPLTKQEMARKRNIVDIVDLSQLSDDDMPPPPKAPRIDETSFHSHSPVPSSGSDPFHGFRRTDTPNSIPGPPNFQPDPRHLQSYTSPYFNPILPPPPPPPPPFALPSTRQRELTNSEGIVQQVDDSKAMKRRRYNPKTVVRDVLIAAGRHPTENPLNYHLNILRKTFKHVNDVSDLDTFRWDLVDPGEPLPAAIAKDSHDVPNAGLIDEADGNEADDEDQDVRHDAGQNPNNGAAESSVTIAAPVAASQLGTQTPKLLGPQRKRRSKQSGLPMDKPLMSSGLNGSVNHPVKESSPKTPSSVPQSTPLQDGSGSTGIRRRGRPPGSRNKNPRKSIGTPSQSNGMPPLARINTTPARPSGLRNSIASTDGVAIVVPSPSPSIVDQSSQKRRGRPPKKSTPKSSQQSTPIHRVYKCQWGSCPAELHNLETLRKHVNKHGNISKDGDAPFPCLWKGCGKAVTAQESNNNDEEEEEPEHQPLTFATHDIWTKHMEKRHIADYAWKLGDGPSLRSDSDMSDYLSDSIANRQVTPIIHKQGRPDPLPLTASSKAEKVYHQAHGITTELEKAQAFLEASQRRRESFGPGLDRGGATFVTKRKRELLDDSSGPLRKVQKGGE